MAHTVIKDLTVTLVATTVSTQTLDAGPDVVYPAQGTSQDGETKTPELGWVEVMNIDGAEAVYFLMTKGDDASVFAAPSDPTVKGAEEFVVPKVAGGSTRIPCDARQAIVKLISPGTPTVVVRSAEH